MNKYIHIVTTVTIQSDLKLVIRCEIQTNRQLLGAVPPDPHFSVHLSPPICQQILATGLMGIAER